VRLLIAERDEARQAHQFVQAETVKVLRQVCEQHGDNDWPDDLHLADIIEKHLWRHLEWAKTQPNEPIAPGPAAAILEAAKDVVDNAKPLTVEGAWQDRDVVPHKWIQKLYAVTAGLVSTHEAEVPPRVADSPSLVAAARAFVDECRPSNIAKGLVTARATKYAEFKVAVEAAEQAADVAELEAAQPPLAEDEPAPAPPKYAGPEIHEIDEANWLIGAAGEITEPAAIAALKYKQTQLDHYRSQCAKLHRELNAAEREIVDLKDENRCLAESVESAGRQKVNAGKMIDAARAERDDALAELEAMDVKVVRQKVKITDFIQPEPGRVLMPIFGGPAQGQWAMLPAVPETKFKVGFFEYTIYVSTFQHLGDQQFHWAMAKTDEHKMLANDILERYGAPLT
jgi:hypothetical protein